LELFYHVEVNVFNQWKEMQSDVNQKEEHVYHEEHERNYFKGRFGHWKQFIVPEIH
jgi:hypothetical protein